MSKLHALLIGINRYPNIENADLRGSVNDAKLMLSLLVDRFGFDPKSIAVLFDEQASRAAILEWMNRIVIEAAEDDIVVLYFAGHGSRLTGLSGEHPNRESIVPADSGRGSAPNTDILDVEIDEWVQRVNRTTPFVTLVMDCCHSGSVTRDPFGERTRSIDADLRGSESWVGAESRPNLVESVQAHQLQLVGLIAGYRHAVVLAACRAEELAWEHRWFNGETVERNGAFTFHFSQELMRARPESTWRSLFELLAPAVNRAIPSQHPLLEGRADDLLFGRSQAPVMGYLPVVSVAEDEVVLGGGVAHCVRLGSRWEIQPATTKDQDDIALLVVVERVESTTCVARLEDSANVEIVQGNRALLFEDVVEPELLIHLPNGNDRRTRGLRAALEKEELLSVTDKLNRAAIKIQRLTPRSRVDDGDPCADLGPLGSPHWAAVGVDGFLATRLQPETDHIGADIDSLVRDLLRVARFRNVLEIENPDRDGSLRNQVQLKVRTLAAKGSETTATRSSGHPLSSQALCEGDCVDFEITNTSESEVHFTLFELGTDYQIRILAPYPGHPTARAQGIAGKDGGIKLAPGKSFSVHHYLRRHPDLTDDVRDGLCLRLPPGFPWSTVPGSDGSSGRIYLKLTVTSAPTDFSFLAQPGARTVGDHPLERLAFLGTTGRGSRSFAPSRTSTNRPRDWDTVTLAVDVRK